MSHCCYMFCFVCKMQIIWANYGFTCCYVHSYIKETYNLSVIANVMSSKATDINTSSIIIHIVSNIDEKTFHIFYILQNNLTAMAPRIEVMDKKHSSCKRKSSRQWKGLLQPAHIQITNVKLSSWNVRVSSWRNQTR